MDIEIEYLTSYTDLIVKTNYSLGDLLSIIIYSFHNLSNDIFYQDYDMWHTFYTEFSKELEKQQNNWPKYSIINDAHKKRSEINLYEPFIISNNLLTFLYRILYIENIKTKNKKVIYNVLDKIIIKNKSLFDMNLNELFDYLRLAIDYYNKHYDNLSMYENIISARILKIID